MTDTKERVYAYLAERLQYEDGKLVWNANARKDRVGKVAGRKDALGYLRIHALGKTMVAVHRVIFYMHHGWVPELVDHIDGDNCNNRIENLRAATRLGNSRNCKTPATNTSGVKGVYWREAAQCWIASIRINKKLTHLGTFKDIFSAACARKSAEARHYGEFAR